MYQVVIHCHKVEARADVKQVRAIVAVATASWDPAALRTEHLTDKGRNRDWAVPRMERHR
jgi:hypothetical protein